MEFTNLADIFVRLFNFRCIVTAVQTSATKTNLAVVGAKKDTPILMKLENKFWLTYDKVVFISKYWLVLSEGFDEFKLEVNVSHKIDDRRDKADSQSQNGEKGRWCRHFAVVIKCDCGRVRGEKKPSNIALPSLGNNSFPEKSEYQLRIGESYL